MVDYKVMFGNRVYLYSGATIILLFSVLIGLGLTIIGTDDICKGTPENPCISYGKICNTMPKNFDIYNADEVKLGFSPEIKEYWLFFKDGRYKKEMLIPKGINASTVGWRFENFTNDTKPRLDRKYVHRFAMYTCQEYMIVGLKNNPTDKIKWSLGLGNEELDPVWDAVDDKKKPSNFIGSGGETITWNITKTGAEEHLDVDYYILNDTATQFCVQVDNRIDYESELSLSAKDINEIPVEKMLLANEFEVDTISLNLSKESKEEIRKCFIVSYPELIEGIQFKIGEASVLIDASATTTATAYGQNEHMCIMDGRCHIAYQGGGNDLWYGNSSYNSDTGACEGSFSVFEVDAGTHSHTGIVCSPNGSIIVYGLESGDVDMVISNDNGGTFTSTITLEDTDTFYQVDCNVDSQSVMHCCMQASGDDLYYVNTSILNDGWEISAADTDHCAIAIDKDDYVYIGALDDGTDDLDVMSSKDGYSTRNELLNAGTIYYGLPYSMDMTVCNNDTFYITFSVAQDLWFCEGSVDDWTSATCSELDSDATFNSNVGCSVDNDPYILYGIGTNSVYLANRTEGGSWQIRNQLHAGSAGFYGTMSDSIQPSGNRLDKVLNYIYCDSSSDVYYDNISISYDTPPPPVTTINCTCPTINANWLWNFSHYCNITTECDIGTGALNHTIDTGWWNITANITASQLVPPITGQIIYLPNSNAYINLTG